MRLWIHDLNRVLATKRRNPEYIPQLGTVSEQYEQRERRVLSSVFSGVWYSSSKFCCRMLTRSILRKRTARWRWVSLDDKLAPLCT